MHSNSKRSGTERLKYGICLNDECSLSKSKEIQSVPMRKELICSECGKELRECAPPKKKGVNKKLLFIIVAILLIAIIVSVLFLLRKKPEQITPKLNKTEYELIIGNIDTLTVTPALTDNLIINYISDNEQVAIISSTGVVRALSAGTANITATISNKNGEPIKLTCKYIVIEPEKDVITDSTTHVDSLANKIYEDSIANTKTQINEKKQSNTTLKSNKLSLSYGYYTGSTKNGYPHGQGRLTYTSSRVINKNDVKKRTAKNGDYVIGEFYNGFVVYGKHYNASGDLLESLNFGIGSENSYDSK